MLVALSCGAHDRHGERRNSPGEARHTAGLFSRFDFEAVCKPCRRGLAAMQACAAMHPVPPGDHTNGLTGAWDLVARHVVHVVPSFMHRIQYDTVLRDAKKFWRRWPSDPETWNLLLSTRRWCRNKKSVAQRQLRQTFSLTCLCDVNILPCKVPNDLSQVHQQT